MKNAIIFIIALAVSNLALAESSAQIYGKYAAPFGLEWGLSEEQVTAMGVKLTPVNPAKWVYRAKTLPKHLSDIERYTLEFHPGFGLIRVTAYTEVRERFNQLKTALVNKYGKPSIEMGVKRPQEVLHWGSDLDGTIKLERSEYYTVGDVTIYLTYQSAALHIDAERKRERESRKREKQTVPDTDAL